MEMPTAGKMPKAARFQRRGYSASNMSTQQLISALVDGTAVSRDGALPRIPYTGRALMEADDALAHQAQDEERARAGDDPVLRSYPQGDGSAPALTAWGPRSSDQALINIGDLAPGDLVNPYAGDPSLRREPVAQPPADGEEETQHEQIHKRLLASGLHPDAARDLVSEVQDEVEARLR